MKRTSTLAAAALLAATVFAPASFAQGSDEELRNEVEALKKGQEQMRKDLAEIKKLLQERPAPAAAPARRAAPNVADTVFDLGDNPVKGADSAKLTLVEFTDYQ